MLQSNHFKRLCVFCGSNGGANVVYVEAARRMGELLVSRDIGLVYGGGCVGLMGTIADTLMALGGEVIGIIPEALVQKEVAHEGLTELRVVGSMHERKAMMNDLSDGFVTMPGGYGTFEEFCEVITWSQLGFHEKPCGILNVNNFYDPLLALFDHAVREQFLRPQHRALIIEDSDPANLLDRMAAFRSPHLDKWIERDET